MVLVGQSSGRALVGALCVAGLVALGTLSACAIGGSGIGSSVEFDRGEKAAAEVEEQIGLVDHPALQGYVEAIGRRLASESTRPDLAYEFRLLDMPEPNAFALPGGFIYVSRGLLVFLNGEDELAAVLGHELGHIAARHHAKQVLRSAPLAPLRLATGIGGALASIVSPTLGSTIAATGQLTSALVLAPYSREQEREADRIGQQLVAASGWDPDAMSTFMATLGREEELRGGDPGRASFLATHPASNERSRAAHQHATSLTREPHTPIAPRHRAFLDRLAGILVGRSASEGTFDGDDFLHPEFGFALTLPTGWEQLNRHEFVGALDRERGRGVILTVAAEGDDAMAVAREVGRRLRLEAAPDVIDLAGVPAARGRAREGELSAELTWIAYRGFVYQINGFARTEDFEQVQPLLRGSANSFRALSLSERGRIREDRLAIAEARAGETLAALVEREGSRWSAGEAAVANATVTDEHLAAGRPIKLTRPVPLSD